MSTGDQGGLLVDPMVDISDKVGDHKVTFCCFHVITSFYCVHMRSGSFSASRFGLMFDVNLFLWVFRFKKLKR